MLENGMAVGAQAEYERQRFGADPQPEPLVAGPLLHPMMAGILQKFLDAQAIIAKATKVPE
jgi:hypothetical protein